MELLSAPPGDHPVAPLHGHPCSVVQVYSMWLMGVVSAVEPERDTAHLSAGQERGGGCLPHRVLESPAAPACHPPLVEPYSPPFPRISATLLGRDGDHRPFHLLNSWPTWLCGRLTSPGGAHLTPPPPAFFVVTPVRPSGRVAARPLAVDGGGGSRTSTLCLALPTPSATLPSSAPPLRSVPRTFTGAAFRECYECVDAPVWHLVHVCSLFFSV